MSGFELLHVKAKTGKIAIPNAASIEFDVLQNLVYGCLSCLGTLRNSS